MSMIAEFCKLLCLSEKDLLGRSRAARTAISRHVYFWLLRKSGYTYSEIGRMNGRHPSAVRHSVHVVNAALAVQDPQITEVWATVRYLRATKTVSEELGELRPFRCPHCHGSGRVVVFEDWLSLAPPDTDVCEVCVGNGTVTARKIVRHRNVIIIKT